MDDAAGIIQEMGAGTLLAKMVLEHAYRNIPIHQDDRLLLAMRWIGKLYLDTVLPFGLRSAPKILPSYCHTVKLSYCQTVLTSYCHTVLLSYCHTVILSHCHTVILSYCHCLTVSYITISLHHSTITYVLCNHYFYI